MNPAILGGAAKRCQEVACDTGPVDLLQVVVALAAFAVTALLVLWLCHK